MGNDSSFNSGRSSQRFSSLSQLKLRKPLRPLGNGPLIPLEGFNSVNIWLVEGFMPLGRITTFRTMIVLRPKNTTTLILINAIRLHAEQEQQLLALGEIAAVVRQSSINAGFDDLYYVEKFNAMAYAYKDVHAKDRDKPWSCGEWEFFQTNLPLKVFGLEVQVIDVPRSKSNEFECVFYLPKERTLIVADLIQNNDLSHTKFYGMTLSDLKLPSFSLFWLKFAGHVGHLHTPKSYVLAKALNETNISLAECHGELMDLEWDRILCHHGGPSLHGAKRLRREAIMKDWPAVAFGSNVQLALT